MQITALREQETKLGAANHKVQSWDVEKVGYKDTEMVEGELVDKSGKSYGDLASKASKEKEVQEVKKKANKKSKYAAAAGAVAGAAVVGALS